MLRLEGIGKQLPVLLVPGGIGSWWACPLPQLDSSCFRTLRCSSRGRWCSLQIFYSRIRMTSFSFHFTYLTLRAWQDWTRTFSLNQWRHMIDYWNICYFHSWAAIKMVDISTTFFISWLLTSSLSFFFAYFEMRSSTSFFLLSSLSIKVISNIPISCAAHILAALVRDPLLDGARLQHAGSYKNITCHPWCYYWTPRPHSWRYLPACRWSQIFCTGLDVLSSCCSQKS